VKPFEVKVGNVVRAYGHARVAELSGVVVSVGRVNVKIETKTRFSPTGPWFVGVHTVPKREITTILGVAP